MGNVEFYYFLDRVFPKGKFTFNEALKLRKSGSQKELEENYNPEKTSIYIGATINGKFVKENTGCKVKPIEWDFDAKEFKKRKNPDWYEYNLYLSSILNEVNKKYIKMKMKNPNLNSVDIKEMLREIIRGETVKKKEMGFFDVYSLFLEEKKKISKAKTFTKYKVLEVHLRAFSKKNYTLTFNKINKQFETDFKIYSIEDKKHLNNTISRNLKCIKVFMKWAKEHPDKFHNTSEYEKFSAPQDESNIVALTYEEFLSIYNLNLEDDTRLDKVRDIFVFQCLTGQRYSDIRNFRMKDLKQNDNELEWHLWQIKNNKRDVVVIPLLQKAVEIVRKYLENRTFLENEPILPVISIDKMNKYLKEIGQLANLHDLEVKVNYSGVHRVEKSSKKWELLSTHCARRTFITLSLELGMRSEVVRAITGQKSEKIMLKYVGIKNSVKRKELLEAWSEMN